MPFLEHTIASHSVQGNSYADDTQLQKSSEYGQARELVSDIEACIQDVKSWMTCNKLKLNDGKTEALIISSQRASLPARLPTSLAVGDSTVSFSQTAKNLGVILDSHLTLNAHVSSVIRAVNHEFRQIGSIRRFLSIEATKTLVSAHILSRLDYCNGILINSTQDTIQRLQKLQYNAARLILRVPRREHMTPHLFKLHWLPVDARIKYKIACLSYRAFHGVGPVYLSDLVQIHVPARVTRSASDKFTLEPRRVITKSFGERAFYYAAPEVWNSLPLLIRSIEDESVFRSALKTHLFRKAYNL